VVRVLGARCCADGSPRVDYDDGVEWPWRRSETAATKSERRDSLARALVGAAVAVSEARRSIFPQEENWQRDVWTLYETLGEFAFAVTWKSEMISRVRLRAGRLDPGQDEPIIVDTGPAAEIVAKLAGGIGGRSQMLSSLAVYLEVPGEGFLIGERVNGSERWQVRSRNELREHGKNPDDTSKFQIVDETSLKQQKWRDVAPDSLVVRIWRPDKRDYHLATSPAKAARGIMRELDLVNRHIQAQYLSRLASAGVFVMPDEVTFPVREEFEGEPDAFVKEWIETAQEAIKTPGTAAAVVPIPLQVPGEYIDKFKHFDFTLKIDEKIIEKRDSAIRRLATALDVPAEILLGLGDVNHWSAWQIEESAVKAHISPLVELICYDLTVGYLLPQLEAMGATTDDPVGTTWVVWYDASELTLRPDRSENAVKAYDRFEINGKALRRETGFDEADAPTDDELQGQILRFATRDPTNIWIALDKLVPGFTLMSVPVTAPALSGTGQPPEGETPNEGAPPKTQGQPPSPPDSARAREHHQLRKQARLPHAVRFNVDGSLDLFHPYECRERLFSCPVTHATVDLADRAHPGATGVYECWLNVTGDAIVGRLAPQLEVNNPEHWICTNVPARSGNGKVPRPVHA
jgi:hypothetical protein